MINIPKIKIGIVAVSRDCFPEPLSVNRRKALVEAYKAKYDETDIYECPVLETSDRRFPRHCSQNISMDRKCLWQLQKRAQ